MDERPGLRVEDRGSRLLVVVRRGLVDLEQRVEGQELRRAQEHDRFRPRLALCQVVAFDDAAAVELGEPLVEPQRQAREVQREQPVRVLVVQHLVGVLVRTDVGPHNQGVAVGAGERETGRSGALLALPERGQQGPHGLLVLDRDDDGGLGAVHAGPGPLLLEHGAHALELQGNRFRRLLSGVGDDREVCALRLQPHVIRARGGDQRRAGHHGGGTTDRAQGISFPRCIQRSGRVGKAGKRKARPGPRRPDDL